MSSDSSGTTRGGNRYVGRSRSSSFRTVLVFAFMEVLIARGTYMSFSASPPTRRTWPLIAVAAFGLGAIPASVYLRGRPELDPARTQILLAFAFSPIISAVGGSAMGAALWIPWAAAALAFVLAAWWAWDTRARRRAPEKAIH
jgi:hypothetical protein